MFMMNYADKWSENKVTAITDLESETTSFYAWNGTKLDTELFEIKVFPSANGNLANLMILR